MPLPVVEHRGTRVGVGVTLVAAASAGLLAAGFGMLGGRPGPSASPPLGGLGPTAPQATPADVVPTPALPSPAVTPFSSCAPAPTSAPQVVLQVNGRPTPGFVEILLWDVASPAPDASPPFQAYPDRVSVPVDVITELWITGGACAAGWNVGLVGNEVLNEFLNPGLDPALASQNRFGLVLAPFGGRDLVLRADLFFPTLIARALWDIHVEPFERPVASLQGEDDPRSIVEGCGVELVLGNGYEYPGDPGCTGDLPFEPAGTLAVERDQGLEFGLGDWDVQGASLTCGRLSGTSFVAEPEPGCFLEATGRSTSGTSITFPELPADLEAGAWTMAISACARSGGLVALNHICGTWYANLVVRG